MEHSPFSSTKIIDNQQSKFTRLIQYVKHKETNAIQSILPLSTDVGHNLFLICFERKIICYDFNNSEIIGHLDFKYQPGRNKILEENQLKLKYN